MPIRMITTLTQLQNVQMAMATIPRITPLRPLIVAVGTHPLPMILDIRMRRVITIRTITKL